MTNFMIGFATGIGLSIAFFIFACWHNRRYPQYFIPEQHEHVPADERCKTHIQWPPG